MRRLFSLFGALSRSSNNISRFYSSKTMATAAGSGKPNRLINERSPYLLQHAYNPVDWYPWGPAAFEKAKKDNKMIFLSVGYSTCHWCHVMERESFENDRIGKLMNDNFVNIKVDREERPDVDKLYMAFVQATAGGGGWPMSVWLTPDLKPVVGGTYFPPDDSHFGRPGFGKILTYIAEQWRENADSVRQQGSGILEALEGMGRLSVRSNSEFPAPGCISKCYKMITDTFDPEWGGFGSAPKFPQPVNFDAVLRAPFCRGAIKEADPAKMRAEVIRMVGFTLKKMANGGIHDHVSQGFHRYSTDRKWHVPHFEKMLYDQGQLAVTFAEMYQITNDQFYADILRDILTYVSRDLSHGKGGFFSAEDADSYPKEGDKEKKEGAFCVWTHSELKELLSAPLTGRKDATIGDLFMKHYAVKADGNVNPQQDPHGELKGKNVLISYGTLKDTADSFEVSVDEAKQGLEQCRKILFEARQKRPKPHLDTKMLTAWNGLMISGFAKGAAVLCDTQYKDRAVKAAEFVRKYLYDGEKGVLLRSAYTDDKENVIQIPQPICGFADDYSFFIAGLLDLYECSFDDQWLKWASELQAKMDSLFWDTNGKSYFQTASGDPSIIVRMKEEQDGAEPSANSVATLNLLRLGDFLDNDSYRDKAKEIMTAFGGHLEKVPVALPKMICAYMYNQMGGGQVVIVGSDDDQTRALANAASLVFSPFNVLIVLDGKHGQWLKGVNNHLETLRMIKDKPTAFICKNFICSPPIHTVDELRKALDT